MKQKRTTLTPWLVLCCLLLAMSSAHAAEGDYRLGMSVKRGDADDDFSTGGTLSLTHPNNFGWGLEAYQHGFYYYDSTTPRHSEEIQSLQGFYSFRGSVMNLDLGLGAGRVLYGGETTIFREDGLVLEKFARGGVSLGSFGIHMTKIYQTQKYRKKAVNRPYEHQKAGDVTETLPLWFFGLSWDF